MNLADYMVREVRTLAIYISKSFPNRIEWNRRHTRISYDWRKLRLIKYSPLFLASVMITFLKGLREKGFVSNDIISQQCQRPCPPRNTIAHIQINKKTWVRVVNGKKPKINNNLFSTCSSQAKLPELIRLASLIAGIQGYIHSRDRKAVLSSTVLASGQERELVTERDTPKRISMKYNLNKNNKLPRFLGA